LIDYLFKEVAEHNNKSTQDQNFHFELIDWRDSMRIEEEVPTSSSNDGKAAKF